MRLSSKNKIGMEFVGLVMLSEIKSLHPRSIGSLLHRCVRMGCMNDASKEKDNHLLQNGSEVCTKGFQASI